MIGRCDDLFAKAGLVVALLSGCNIPPMFSVAVDEPILEGSITLNGGSAPLMKNLDGAYWAKWREVAAEGAMVVTFADRKTASCPIAYVPGSSPQRQAYAIRDRQCRRLPNP